MWHILHVNSVKKRSPAAKEYTEGSEAVQRFEAVVKQVLITPRPKARRMGRLPVTRQASG